MIEVSQIFSDENHSCEIDFSAANWATDQLNNIFHQAKLSILHDVDFVAETDEAILLVEYKNSNLANAANPGAFKPLEDKKLDNVARKYYESQYLLQAVQHGLHKEKRFVYILEHDKGNSTMRNLVRTHLAKRLPFLLQQQVEMPEKMIDSIEVLSIEEWNEQYPQFPLKLMQDSFSGAE